MCLQIAQQFPGVSFCSRAAQFLPIPPATAGAASGIPSPRCPCWSQAIRGAAEVAAKPPASPCPTRVVETLQVAQQRARFCNNEGYTTLPCSLGTHLMPSVWVTISPVFSQELVSLCPCGSTGRPARIQAEWGTEAEELYPPLRAKLKGLCSALPPSQEIAPSVSDVTVGNGGDRGSAWRAASSTGRSQRCQKAGVERESGQLSLQPAAARGNSPSYQSATRTLAETGVLATPLLPSF